MATFTKAIKDVGLSVRVSSDGKRNVGGNAHMDNGSNQSVSHRGRGNRSRGGRWQRGGNFRGRGGRGRGRGNAYHPRSRFEEDDDGDADMGNSGYESKSRYRPYGGGHNQNRNRDRSPDRDASGSDSEWWKVTIPDGKKHSRDWLLRKLKQMSNVPFTEVNLHLVQDNLCFFVNEKLAADALRTQSNRITTKDGSKIFISVKPSRPPRNQESRNQGSNSTTSDTRERFSGPRDNNEIETDSTKIDVFKTCLGGRYHVETFKLDLTNLFSDSVLRGGNVDGRVYVPKFMNTVLHLVHELVPNLKIMDLSNNRLQRLDTLRKLPEMCPDLEELNLSNNQIHSTNELSKINEHKKITKLWLAQNPVQEQFKSDKASYFSAVRSYLPELKELDGEVLPPSIKFDLQPESDLPKSAGNYFANKAASDLVVRFLQNFFQVYDLDDTNERQQLLAAYHSDAVFSMCCNTGVFQTDKSKSALDAYFQKSRNLRRLKENSNVRSQLIKRKKLGVVAHLVEFPQTKHQFNSFTLDVTLVTPTCIMFTVKGLFLEGTEKTLRGFARTFIAVPESNSQFLIVNDQLHIRNPTEKQLEKLKGLPDTIGQQQSTATETTTYTIEQQEMVKKFSANSGLNLQFSLEALVSNSWNFEQAALQFNQLKQSGKIPAEAYAK